MRSLKHHPGILMRNDAADALDALEDKYGPIIINRGSVSEAVQQGLIDRWNKGGRANRPPFLFQPKSPARASDHVLGIGLDVYNYTDDRAKLKEFGYEWYGKSDPVHYTFRGWSRPTHKPAPNEESDDTMVEVTINGKVYLVAPRYLKHVNNVPMRDDFRTITKVRQFTLTDNRRIEAFGNLLKAFGVPDGVIDNRGYVLDPVSGTYSHGNVWSGDLANADLIKQLSR